MRRFATPWLLLIALFLGSGCAATIPPATIDATTLAMQASSAQAQSPPLPQPALENQSFVTIDGIPRYKIGPGDVLEVLLTKGLTQEKHTVVVKQNGLVNVAFFTAQVGGLTAEQAADKIHEIMSPFYKQLSVEVLVTEYHSKQVSVFGAVRGKPGTYPLKGRTTLLDLLAEVGGPTATASLDDVRLIRPGGLSYAVNLHVLLADGTTPVRDVEIVLDANDMVYVPSTEDKKVFVLGEAKNPGAYPMVANMRLSQVLAYAGGAKDTAVLESARVIRGNFHDPQIIAVDFQRLIEQGDLSQDLRIEVNDVVFLPRSAIGDWNAFMEKLKPTLYNLNLLMQPAINAAIFRDLVRNP